MDNKSLFKDFTYLVNPSEDPTIIDVKVSFLFNEKYPTEYKIEFIAEIGRDPSYYIERAKAIVTDQINSGYLVKYARQYVKDADIDVVDADELTKKVKADKKNKSSTKSAKVAKSKFSKWWFSMNEWIRIALCAVVAGGLTCAIAIPLRLSGAIGGGGRVIHVYNVELQTPAEDEGKVLLTYGEKAIGGKDFVAKVQLAINADDLAVPNEIVVYVNETQLGEGSYTYTPLEGLDSAEVVIPAEQVKGSIVIGVELADAKQITFKAGDPDDTGAAVAYFGDDESAVTTTRKARVGEIPVVGISTPTNLTYSGTTDKYVYSWPSMGKILSDITYEYTATWQKVD